MYEMEPEDMNSGTLGIFSNRESSFISTFFNLGPPLLNLSDEEILSTNLDTNFTISYSKETKKPKSKPFGMQVVACLDCGKCFKTRTELKHHSVAHSDLRPYTCRLCLKTFKHPSTLKNHTKVHNGQLNHECDVCHKRFLKPVQLKTHYRVHSGEKPFRCSLCNKMFATQQQLNRHQTTHTGEKKYQCNLCSKRFTDHSALRYHTRTHTGERPYQCSVCEETFITKLSAERHRQCKHTDTKVFPCNLCGKPFKFKNYLTKHMLVHTKRRAYKCKVCPLGFPTSFALKRHTQTHSSVKPYSCCVCDQNFCSERSLLKHLAIHGRLHHFKCTNCDKTFLTNKCLRRHSELFCSNNKHVSFKYANLCEKRKKNKQTCGNFICNVCGLMFNSLCLLYGKHIGVHKTFGKTQVKCRFCNKGFWERFKLLKHIPIHKSIGGLRHYMITNSSQRSASPIRDLQMDELMCKKCVRPFRSLRDLNIHMAIHSHRMFTCIFCPKLFPLYDDLLLHMKRCHQTQRQYIICGKSQKPMLRSVKKNNDKLKLLPENIK